MAASVNDRVIELIAEKADKPASELGMDQTLEEIGLDSLHLMEMALWMRKEYDVVIQEGDIQPDQTLREAISYLVERTP